MLPHPDPTGGADGAGAEAGKEGNATGAASEASIGLFSREEDPFRPPVSFLGMKSYGTAPTPTVLPISVPCASSSFPTPLALLKGAIFFPNL